MKVDKYLETPELYQTLIHREEKLVNIFFAVSLDLYNKKEYIVYSIDGQEVTKVRELGQLLFDFADPVNEPERYNAAAEYLSYFPEKRLEPLLTEEFFEAQKHLKLNSEHRYSAYDIIKRSDADWGTSRLDIFFRKGLIFISTENDFIGLIRLYLDQVYSAMLFPRKCMSCGRFFLSGKKHGNVLCYSDECRKKKKVENTMAYYNRLSENETLYIKIYRKWKQRIDRAEKTHTVDDDGIVKLRQALTDLIKTNRIWTAKQKIGDMDFDDQKYCEALKYKDQILYQLFNSEKRK